MTDQEFRDMVRDAKDSRDIVEVIGQITTLRRVGHEYVGLCFLHEEQTSSLSVNPNKQVYLCRGCGKSGDVIRAVQHIQNCDWMTAVRHLLNDNAPRPDPAKRIQAIIREETDRAQRIADAIDVWKSTTALDGTLGEVYLRSRGITSWTSSIRFTETWWWCDQTTGETSAELPAVIGMVQDEHGFTGIQRIFLQPDGMGKAITGPSRAKMSLGKVRGGALRLGPPAHTIYVTEGPEDGLSLRQEMPGASVWVALGTANMPAIRYPAEVAKIVICAQNDGPAETATVAAAAALIEQGYMVEVRRPSSQFKDWNDQIRGIRANDGGAA